MVVQPFASTMWWILVFLTVTSGLSKSRSDASEDLSESFDSSTWEIDESLRAINVINDIPMGERDTAEYRVITLPNQLQAVLVSDPSFGKVHKEVMLLVITNSDVRPVLQWISEWAVGVILMEYLDWLTFWNTFSLWEPKW